MIIRTALATVVLAVIPGSGLPGQGPTVYTIPDSLRHLNLPADPTKYVRQVVASAHTPSNEYAGKWRAGDMLFMVGCAANGGWAGAAFTGMVNEAATDRAVRRHVAAGLGMHLSFNITYGYDLCSVDYPRIERLLGKWLRQEWEAGMLAAPKVFDEERVHIATGIMYDLQLGDEPETYQLLRSIARDSTVYADGTIPDGFEYDLRRDAAGFMLVRRIREGKTIGEAVAAVEADLAGAVRRWGDWTGLRPPRRASCGVGVSCSPTS